MQFPDQLITTYLQMTSTEQLRPAYQAAPHTLLSLQIPDLDFYRFLYQTVGREWRWRDRLTMPDDTLRAVLARSQVEVLYIDGAPAGYIELAPPATDGSIEVAYFGLRAAFMGRGWGKHLLSHGVARAWDSGATRVWLHTCNLDGPHAMANYQARGFTVYDVKTEPMPALYREG